VPMTIKLAGVVRDVPFREKLSGSVSGEGKKKDALLGKYLPRQIPNVGSFLQEKGEHSLVFTLWSKNFLSRLGGKKKGRGRH